MKPDLDLRDVIVVETKSGTQLEFETVGLVQDDEGKNYAICYCAKEDQFIVTDAAGELLENEALAQEILDEFFVLSEESSGDGAND